MVKNPPVHTRDIRAAGSIPREDLLEEGMATHSSILACRIPWTEELTDYSPKGHKEPNTMETTEPAHMHVLIPTCLHSFLGPLLHMEIISPIAAFGHYLVGCVPICMSLPDSGQKIRFGAFFPFPIHPTILAPASPNVHSLLEKRLSEIMHISG